MTDKPTTVSAERIESSPTRHIYQVSDSKGQAVTITEGVFTRTADITCIDSDAKGPKTSQHTAYKPSTKLVADAASAIQESLTTVRYSQQNAAADLLSIIKKHGAVPEKREFAVSDATPLDAFCASPAAKAIEKRSLGK